MTPEEYQKSLCPCCLFPSNTQSLTFRSASLENIGKVSLRAKEYFQMIIFFFLALLILFCVNSIPHFILNESIAHCFLSFCYDDVDELQIYYTSLDNKDNFEYIGLPLLLLLSIFLIFILKYLFFFFLVRQNKVHEKSVNQIKQYSVHAHNLRGFTDEEICREIVDAHNNKKFSSNKNTPLASEDIVEISKIKNVHNVHSLLVKFITELKSSKMRKLKKSENKKKKEESEIRMKKLRKKILDIKRAEYINEAFITFNGADVPERLVSNKWSMMFKRYVTRDLFFTQAYEPTDVIWENFGTSDLVRLMKIALSYFVALIILISRLVLFFFFIKAIYYRCLFLLNSFFSSLLQNIFLQYLFYNS